MRRIRVEGTRNLMAAAKAAGARRVIAQSVAFVYAPGAEPHHEDDPLALEGPGKRTAEGIAALEWAVLRTPPIEGIVLRYGRLYGPGTWTDVPEGRGPLHVDAAAHAALLALDRGVGIYNIAEDDGAVAIDKARMELGFDPDNQARRMSDPNNRPGGPHLVVTAKTANKVQFFDATTLALSGEIDMPASTHEMILSPDGARVFASVYGGGIFGKNNNPDRRIAVIDLASRSLERMIDVGADVAPHGVMMAGDTLWATAELGDAVLAIDPGNDRVERIGIGGRAHWVATSVPSSQSVARSVARCSPRARPRTSWWSSTRRAARRSGQSTFPISPKGLRSRRTARRFTSARIARAKSTRSTRAPMRYRKTVPIEGAPGSANQLRRVRVSPDGRTVVVASLVDCHVAIYQADTLNQIGSLATRKAPMGFGFAADGAHAFVCCHDDATVMEFELSDRPRNARVQNRERLRIHHQLLGRIACPIHAGRSNPPAPPGAISAPTTSSAGSTW